MSSKVKCTCGWSWNKSDSSKKDMYICHQCGKDNSMKNGGWLNKFDVPEAQLGKAVSDNTTVKKPIVQNIIGLAKDPDIIKYNKVKNDEQWGDPYKFLMNWYADPEIKKRLKSQGAPEKPMTEALNQKRYDSYLDWYFATKDKNIKDARNIWKDDYTQATKLSELLNRGLESEFEYLRNNTSGFHMPKDSLVALNSSLSRDDMSSTAVHELTHATPLDNYYLDYFKKNKPKNPSGSEEKYFFENPEEIYPRIQELRYQLWRDKKIAPGTKITPSLLEGYNNNNSEDLRNYYSPEELSKIMNEIAYKPNNKKPIPQAQNGIEGTMGGLTDQGFNYNGAWGGTMAMGGSLPGSVGFTYARTQGSAPANGKYTKKTKASAQNGEEMKYYQEGLDWKPKNISRDGSVIEDDMGQWAHPGEITRIPSNQITMQGVDYPVLGISDTGDTQMMYPNQDYTYDGESVTEYPMMQGGGKVSLRSLINNDDLKAKSDATKIVKALAPNKVVGSPTRNQGTISVPYEKSIREKAISTLKKYNDPVSSIVTAPAVSALNLLRPDRYFEDVNSESDIKDALLNFGLDAVMVAPIAGELSPYINKTLKSTRQYLPEKGQFINEIKDLKRAIAPPQPTFINPAEQELLSTVRNVGIMSKTGVNDAAVLEKILNKSVQLGEKEFENLVGSTRSQIQEKIQALKASGSTKKPDVNNEVIDLSRRPSSQTTIAEDLGIDQDPGWLRLQERLRNRNQSASNPPYDEVGNIVSEPSTSDIARAIQSQEQIDLSIINQLPDPPIYFSLEDFGSFDFSGPTNKSLIRGLTERVNKNKYLPLVADESDSLLPVLYRDQSNNPTADILKAYRTLENAPSGSTFKGASSLSTDSYPATLRMTQKALKNDIADVNYIGMGDINFSGFTQSAKIPKDINLKEINTMIDKLNKKLPKPIPYAYEKDYRIVAPQITVTRKKNGGWLNKYN
jgi:hypothetical protein